MSRTFKKILIIYNPKSNAKQLYNDLRESSCRADIQLVQTTHAGHAEEIAQEYADTTDLTLLVSSSGDGGYHELINGVIASANEQLVTAVLPSGNANDHHRAVGSKNIVTSIVAGDFRRIDVIKISSKIGGRDWSRYAHSYIGLGLTPAVGKQLTKTDLNFFNEKILLLKYLFRYTHVTIRHNEVRRRLSSLVFSNISQMSKIIKIAKASTVDDGKFEISAIIYRSKLRVLLALIKSTTFGLGESGSFSDYSFETIRRTLVQLDGEVYTIDKKSDVHIESVAGALQMLE